MLKTGASVTHQSRRQHNAINPYSQLIKPSSINVIKELPGNDSLCQSLFLDQINPDPSWTSCAPVWGISTFHHFLAVNSAASTQTTGSALEPYPRAALCWIKQFSQRETEFLHPPSLTLGLFSPFPTRWRLHDRRRRAPAGSISTRSPP